METPKPTLLSMKVLSESGSVLVGRGLKIRSRIPPARSDNNMRNICEGRPLITEGISMEGNGHFLLRQCLLRW